MRFGRAGTTRFEAEVVQLRSFEPWFTGETEFVYAGGQYDPVPASTDNGNIYRGRRTLGGEGVDDLGSFGSPLRVTSGVSSIPSSAILSPAEWSSELEEDLIDFSESECLVRLGICDPGDP